MPARKAKPSAEAASQPQPASAPLLEVKGKLGLLIALLSRPDGATIADLAEATGWQDHSIRGALAGALKKRGYHASSVRENGQRVYRLPNPGGVDA